MGIKRKEGDGQKAGGSADQLAGDCSAPEGQTGRGGLVIWHARGERDSPVH